MSNPAPVRYVVTLYRYAAAYSDPRRAAPGQPGRSLTMRFEPQNRTEVELAAGATATDALELVLADRILTAGCGLMVVKLSAELGPIPDAIVACERFAVEAMVMPERPAAGGPWEASHFVATVDVNAATMRVEAAASETDAAWSAALDRLRRGAS